MARLTGSSAVLLVADIAVGQPIEHEPQADG